jgi:hypothetical protein
MIDEGIQYTVKNIFVFKLVLFSMDLIAINRFTHIDFLTNI